MAKERKAETFVPVEEQPYPIPENWKWVFLGTYIDYVTDYVANGSFATLKDNVNIYKEENYALMVKTADFANSFTKSLTYTDKHGYEFLSKSVLYGGELILSNIGSIGKVFRVPYFKRPMTLASNSVMIKCLHEQDYDWLYHFFLSPIGFEELMSITTGTAVLKFNKTDLKTILLPVPPYAEQHRIVDRIESLFAKLDEAKDKAQAVVDGYEDRKAAILHQAFTGELTAEWRNEHDQVIDNWTRKNLSSVTVNHDSERIPLSKSEREHLERKYDYYGASGVIDKVDHYLFEGRYLLIGEDGANLVTRSKPIAFIAEGQFWVNNHAHILSTTKELLLDYLCYYINSIDLIPYVSGSAQPKMTQAKMNTIPVPIPSIDEQAEIVRIIKETVEGQEQAVELAGGIIERIDTMKKAILARAFRGELGTNDPTEPPVSIS